MKFLIKIQIILLIIQKLNCLKLQNKVKDGPRPIVPSAQGVGGEVTIPCQECYQMIAEFIQNCVDQEANSVQVNTFKAYCENLISQADSKIKNIKGDYCNTLNAKLASITGETGEEMIDPSKAPNICSKYLNECDKLGGMPKCYSGFCDEYADCIDCPYGMVDITGDGKLGAMVCGGNGICKLGWKDPMHKGGNGYCECTNNMRGLACNQI